MTDKTIAGITKYYAELFHPIKNSGIKLLELGVLKGESLRWFEWYFPEAKIVGFDHRIPKSEFSDRIKIVIGNQNDSLDLQQLGNENGMFDVIIDDCSHYGEYTQKSFDFLFKFLNAGGFYIIEDWTAGFKHPEYRGIDNVVCKIIRNFNNYEIKEVKAIRLPEGGSLVIIKK